MKKLKIIKLALKYEHLDKTRISTKTQERQVLKFSVSDCGGAIDSAPHV